MVRKKADLARTIRNHDRGRGYRKEKSRGSVSKIANGEQLAKPHAQTLISPRVVGDGTDSSSVELLGRLVSCQNVLLELDHVLVPELRSLAIERGRTISIVSQVYLFLHILLLLLPFQNGIYTHLFGSPSKLCRLNSTLPIL
jgi:hypothetical protein